MTHVSKENESKKKAKKQCQEQFVLLQEVVLISRPNHTSSQMSECETI